MSPVDATDGSALPSTASWATRGAQQGSRRGSQAPTSSTPSPRVGNVSVSVKNQAQLQNQDTAATSEGAMPAIQKKETPVDTGSSSQSASRAPARQDDEPFYKASAKLLDPLLQSISSPEFRFVFSSASLSAGEADVLLRHPSLLDPDGGARLPVIRAGQARLRSEEMARKYAQATGRAEAEAALESGSLQLGGEPEGRADGVTGVDATADMANQAQHHQPIQPPAHHSISAMATADAGFAANYKSLNGLSNLVANARGLGPSQPLQHRLSLKTNNVPSGNFYGQYPNSLNAPQPTLAENFRPTQQVAPQGQARQTSRFTFVNDSGLASATVKPTSARFMAQQTTTVMPNGPAGNSHASQGHHQQQQQTQPQQHVGSHLYGNTLPVPPPGLMSTASGPGSAGGLFTQNQGFSGAFGAASGGMGGGNLGHSEDKSELLREMLRTRVTTAGIGGGQGADAGGKRELLSPSLLQPPTSGSFNPPSAPNLLASPFRSQSGLRQVRGLPRQRRRGKKHRHANTSSNGGGGVVDLADPSILHARMQQHGTAGLGQGLYAGHGQGGFNPAGPVYGGGMNRW